MDRGPLLQLLDLYSDRWPLTEGYHRLRQFVEDTPDCFLREHAPGHLTGSALVVDDAERVLLTFHRKLEKWLQLGGHADGETDLAKVAMTEAHEESGLQALQLIDAVPFDLDVHLIPARGEVAAHFHYDVRFLVRAANPHAIVCSEESRELRWFTLEEAYRLTTEPSMHRQFDRFRETLNRSGRPD